MRFHYRVVAALGIIALVCGAAYWNRTELHLRYARHLYPAPSSGWDDGDTPHFVHVLEKAVLVGDVDLGADGRASYWFRSHHQTADYGGALFELPSGTIIFVEGYFCCDVSFSDSERRYLANEEVFAARLRDVDGLAP